MAKVSVSIPQGTRDFSAQVIRKRNYIFQTIRKVFESYGFEPLETPAMEQLDTLMGKYGEEGDKLIFRILNNGLERPEKHEKARVDFEKILNGLSSTGITERALRYDLTIPFARYVAMNHAQLTMPYRRYQIQPVWRADRPQKGRYREFYQCDADIVGSNAPLNEAELASIYADVFQKLNLPVAIKLNNRKILSALASLCGGDHLLTIITTAIDKIDKIGKEKVEEELLQKGLTNDQMQLVGNFLAISGNNEEKLQQVSSLLNNNTAADEGISEIKSLLSITGLAELEVDFSLARGLNYYTGMIFEVKAKGVQMGSIGGGGRYDDLTGLFGVKGIPGVGISFGVDRIYDVLEELQLFPAQLSEGCLVLFFNLGEEECKVSFQLAQLLRKVGIACEIYHEQSKLDKQFKYAQKKGIPNVVIIGKDELEQQSCKIKHLDSGKEETINQESLVAYCVNLKS
jgi:histidyl-tRNA synthetase